MLRHMLFKFIFILVISFSSHETFATLTMQDVLESNPDIADFTPSEFAYHVPSEGSIRTIKGERWEIRYFTFTDGNNTIPAMGFQQLINQKKLTQMEAKATSVNPYLTVWAFTQPPELKNDGIYFTLSLRKLED